MALACLVRRLVCSFSAPITSVVAWLSNQLPARPSRSSSHPLRHLSAGRLGIACVYLHISFFLLRSLVPPSPGSTLPPYSHTRCAEKESACMSHTSPDWTSCVRVGAFQGGAERCSHLHPSGPVGVLGAAMYTRLDHCPLREEGGGRREEGRRDAMRWSGGRSAGVGTLIDIDRSHSIVFLSFVPFRPSLPFPSPAYLLICAPLLKKFVP